MRTARGTAPSSTRHSVAKHSRREEIRLTRGITPTKYRYTGQLAQAEMGLDYYVARWYDPLTGHFTSADSIVPEPGKASAFDRYAYVSNNPIRYNDPTGHRPCDDEVNGGCVTRQDSTRRSSPSSTSSIKLSDRAKNIHGWAKELGYSGAKTLGIILKSESDPANWGDPNWFNGQSGDPALIFEEAATRWFFTWIKDSTVISVYGDAKTSIDRELMMFNWIVSAMQSEDNITLESLRNYSASESFTNMAGRIISGSNNSSWTKGDGMWSWANASLYTDTGKNILNLSYKYKYGTDNRDDNPWFIVDNANLQNIWCYNINYAGSGMCKN